jgi:hypothetical protein
MRLGKISALVSINFTADAPKFVAFENQDCFRSWTAHIDGAITLLRLRGPQQFQSERSGQLLKQASSQMVSNLCAQTADSCNKPSHIFTALRLFATRFTRPSNISPHSSRI